jgi:hypothetical protein
MGRWLERYRAGDRVQVWAEMTSLGPTVREGDSFDDAIEVAQETMRRAGTNVRRLLELLPDRGYEFEESELPVFMPPTAHTATDLDHLEERIGRLPLALRYWFEEVGHVNLVGQHPEWDYDYADPLVVTAPPEFVLSEFEGWEADRGTDWDRGDFVVDRWSALLAGGPERRRRRPAALGASPDDVRELPADLLPLGRLPRLGPRIARRLGKASHAGALASHRTFGGAIADLSALTVAPTVSWRIELEACGSPLSTGTR